MRTKPSDRLSGEAKLNASASNNSQGLFLLRPCAVAAAALLATAVPVLSAAQQEHTPQREWVYRESADSASGELYPAAVLMSRNTLPKAGFGHGYITIGKHPKRPVEVEFSWDSATSWRPGAALCKHGGCELGIRFSGGAAVTFVAVERKTSPALLLQDGDAFVARAARHSGTIDVEFQTASTGGLTAYRFSVAAPLLIEKVKGSKK
jgi:zona occludens toxin (predicted ATPase)